MYPECSYLQNRIKGALDEATNYPNITVRGVYYSKETPQDAAAKVEEVQTANPDTDGWAMIGSWSLFTDALLKWEPGKVKIVAMDAARRTALPHEGSGAKIICSTNVWLG